MILAGIIFIFNLILVYLSIDISKLDSVTEQLKIGMFSSIFVGGKIKCRKRKIKCRIFATNYLSFNLKLKL
ncbi:hypothetical protein KZ590_001538 [Campylobacter jejuni]|nr:hypothetical protein [Campylobacter jejuni]